MKRVLSSALAIATIAIAVPASAETVHASFYGKKRADGSYQFHGQQMASGPRFDMYDPTHAAHKTLDFCTQVRLRNPENGRQLTVVIVDRGPYIAGRDYDLSRAGAERLDFVEAGVTPLEVVDVIPPLRKHQYGEPCDRYLG